VVSIKLSSEANVKKVQSRRHSMLQQVYNGITAKLSLKQETIKGLGHLCLFLLKFHCELNFIEFFWGL
jgi:hypothetical protein